MLGVVFTLIYLQIPSVYPSSHTFRHLQFNSSEYSDLLNEQKPVWLINYPEDFENNHKSLNSLYEIRLDQGNISIFEEFVNRILPSVDAFTDGEVVDALEHFFWGAWNGVAMELGALDGSPGTRSMTYEYEQLFGWHRILIEGDPGYRETLIKNSPKAFSAVAAICETHTKVHFKTSGYIGGILEFMAPQFIAQYHKPIHDLCVPPGNLSSLDWNTLPGVLEVNCMPLNHILHRARIKHINFFILDVEGGELQVLKSINWEHISFDILCVEVEATNRPVGYADSIITYLSERGYHNVTAQKGRNVWFKRDGFIPSSRPGLASDCFNGVERAEYTDRWFLNHKTAPWVKCPLTLPKPKEVIPFEPIV